MIRNFLNLLIIILVLDAPILPAETSPAYYSLVENIEKLAFEFKVDNTNRILVELSKTYFNKFCQRFAREDFTMTLNGTKVFIGVCSNCMIDKGISCGMFDRYFQLKNKEGLVTATISFDPDDISLNITIGQISQVVATQSKLTKTNKSRQDDTAIIYIHGINNVRYKIKGIWQKISQNPKLKKEISMEYCLGPIFSLDSPNYLFKDIYEVEEYYFPEKLRIIMAFDKFEGTLVYALDKNKNQLIINLNYAKRRYYFHIEYRDEFLPVNLDTHCGVGIHATNEIFELTLWIDITKVKAQCNNGAPTSVNHKKPVMLNTSIEHEI